MVAIPAKRVVSYAQNGVGAFIRQCKRMEFRYCDWGGSSEGMR
jgi:large subunit ribosomal protein L43